MKDAGVRIAGKAFDFPIFLQPAVGKAVDQPAFASQPECAVRILPERSPLAVVGDRHFLESSATAVEANQPHRRDQTPDAAVGRLRHAHDLCLRAEWGQLVRLEQVARPAGRLRIVRGKPAQSKMTEGMRSGNPVFAISRLQNIASDVLRQPFGRAEGSEGVTIEARQTFRSAEPEEAPGIAVDPRDTVARQAIRNGV